MWRRLAWVGVAMLGASLQPALAQSVAPRSGPGIDCTKARSAIERALCADPGLLALDRAVARAGDGREALRQEQLRWIKQRDTACALPAAAIPACLRRELSARTAALTPPTSPSTPPPSPTVIAVPPARRAEPAIPDTPIPQAAATLEQTILPANPQAETLLHVTAAGRFTLSAASATGAALQLVDMVTGPSALAGVAGAQDGRIDELLDVGVYKLRVFAAPGATGPVTLSVRPFRAAAPAAALPLPGQPLAATLADGEQRAFWLAVPPSGMVRIEAAGRALGDLRLWRNGRALSTLTPAVTSIEPVPGHRLTDMRLEGKVEPGTYLLIAYGGEAARWVDGETSQPFHLRAGLSDALAAGWTGGTVGPFGSEVFERPPSAGLLRLELPQPQAAEMAAGGQTVRIARDSREPVARLALAPGPAPIEIRAAQGQAYTLRALEHATAQTVTKPGTYWVSAEANGAGGDEVPPTVVLTRTDAPGAPARIVGDTLPSIGAANGWRARFNLRGPTTILAHSLGGAVTLRSTGTPVKGERIDDNLPEGYFAFRLSPPQGALGAVEVTIGPSSVTPPLADALPRDPVLSFGVQRVEQGQRLGLLANRAPGLSTGLSARPVPVALAEAPLSITLAPLASAEVPVAIAPGGTLDVSEVGKGPAPYTIRPAEGGPVVTLPPADHARTIVLAWRPAVPPAPPIPAPAPPTAAASLTDGAPVFFDLARQASAQFDLSVGTGGFYRVETLGRLRTAGRIGTDFLPEIAAAEANGAGENMRLQTMLRAGRYHVTVTAKDSEGHAGLEAAPAPLVTTAVLQPGSTVRAHLPAGTGAAIPIEIAAATKVHLDVLGLGPAWTGRLEDAAGWPITPPGALDDTEISLQAGRDRLVVEPAATSRDLLVRLRAIEPPNDIAGHGPHALPFGAPQAATWREPAGQSDPRTPDRWTFTLEGSATVTLRLDASMVGELRGPGDAASRRIAGRWQGTLPAGAYTLDVASLGRNDRAPYTVSLDSTELQPGAARQVTLPATLPFTIAAPRVVSLTSFGTLPVRATLRDEAGHVVSRFGARPDDWNVAVSLPLPAGRYTLHLGSAAPPSMTKTVLNDAPPAPETDDSSSNGDDTQTASSGDADAAPSVEIRLALPPALDPVPAPEQAAVLDGRGVHALTLPAAGADGLLVAQAVSDAELTLTLERRDASGWRVVARDSGRAPVVAAPGDGDAAAWRARVWLVDGGAEPIRAVAHVVAADAQPPGTVTLAPLPGMAAPIAIARVALPPGLARVQAADGVHEGSRKGHGLEAPTGPVLPVDGEAWLLGPAGAATVTALTPAAGEMLPLTVPGGVTVTLPAADPATLWVARAGEGQPSLGAASGWAPGSAIASASAPVDLQGGADPLRVDLRRVGLTAGPTMAVDTMLQATLPAGGAIPVTLAPGAKRLDLAFAPGTGAILGKPPGAALWAGDQAASRSVSGDWTELLLVNPGQAEAPVTVSTAPAPGRVLAPGGLETRFFGAAGSFETAVRGAPGATLHLRGAGTLTLVDSAGRFAAGSDLPLEGAARALVTHGPGAVALWLEAPGASPWPQSPAETLTLPARIALSGPAAAFALSQTAPVLLHVGTTAPVLLAVGAEQPSPYPQGAELDRVLPPGDTTLRLYPLTDGPLTGSLSLRAAPIVPVGDGLGPETIVAPGGAAAFGFSLDRPATIGVGVRANPDRATARLLDEAGRVVGTGVAQLATLKPGRYVLEAQIPADATATALRPAIVGLRPRGDGPPPDVVREYLELAGMTPQGAVP